VTDQQTDPNPEPGVFSVMGYLDTGDGIQSYYTANVAADGGWESGSPNLFAYLAVRLGQLVRLSPTGSYVPFDLANGTAVLAGLRAWTDVRDIIGDPPDGPVRVSGSVQ
jgi:hypothetical protein